jgi:Ca-activated chloride channel family protein
LARQVGGELLQQRGIAMIAATRIRSITAGALCVLIAASTPTAAVMASPAADAEPTPEVCADLGFKTNGYGDERRAYAIPPPPPTNTSPVVQAPVTTIDSLVVTAQKREENFQDVPLQVTPAPAGRIVGNLQARPPIPPPAGAVETERYPGGASNPIRQVSAEPVSTFSIDVDTASYSNVRRFLGDGVRPPKDAVRVEELVNYFDYGYALPTRADEPFRAFTAVVPSPWAPGKQIVHIGLQGYDIPRDQAPPLNLVFLVDTSGSMSSEDKLPLARKALNVLIDQLRPGDSVAMVAYAGSAGEVLGPTAGTDKIRMRCALTALQAGGSTAGGQGLALAYRLAERNFRKDSVNRVILLTDGDFNVGVADPSKLKDFVADKRKTGIYLSVYGFGRGNYNDTMMQTLAQNGNGTAAYLDSFAEAKKAFEDDFAGNAFPIADDVKIQVEFNPSYVSEYRLIGYETRMLAREDFNNDQVDAGEVGSGVSVTALYEITPVGGPASVDPLRYRPAAARKAPSGELAYLKVRYKLPGGATSKLMQQPIKGGYATLDAAPESTRWAVSVAGFGQTLRGDPWLAPEFGYDRIAALAEGAKGKDASGQRAEFIGLVKGAKDGRRVNE